MRCFFYLTETSCGLSLFSTGFIAYSKKKQRKKHKETKTNQTTTKKPHTRGLKRDNEHHILVFQKTFYFEGIYSPHLFFCFLLYLLMKKNKSEVVLFSKEKSLISRRLKY